MKAPKEDAIHPDKYEVAVVALDSAKGENGESNPEYGSLKKILSTYYALLRPGIYQEEADEGDDDSYLEATTTPKLRVPAVMPRPRKV